MYTASYINQTHFQQISKFPLPKLPYRTLRNFQTPLLSVPRNYWLTGMNRLSIIHVQKTVKYNIISFHSWTKMGITYLENLCTLHENLCTPENFKYSKIKEEKTKILNIYMSVIYLFVKLYRFLKTIL